MKKIIMFTMLLVMALVSLGGCYVGHAGRDGGGGYGGRDGGHDRDGGPDNRGGDRDGRR